MGRPRFVAVNRHVIEVAVPEPAPPPLRIVFASDFHASRRTCRNSFAPVFDAITREQPDVLLLGGDYVCRDLGGLSELAAGFRRLAAPQARYAVLGDHDTLAGRSEICKALVAARFNVLVNDTASLPAPYDEFSVSGLDDVRFGQPNPGALFTGQHAIRIIVAHSPAAFELLKDGPFRLLLCGHTHGGQIALPGGTPIFVPQGHGCPRFAYGRFEVGSGNERKTLITSRGIGCSGIPLRLFAPADIQVCELRPVQAKIFEDFLSEKQRG